MLTSAMCPHGNNTRDDSNILFYISLYSLEPNESTTNYSDPAHHGNDNNYYLGCVIYKKRKHVILESVKCRGMYARSLDVLWNKEHFSHPTLDL